MNRLKDSISPYFSVKSTEYGGRGCFANCDLTQGTIIHQCFLPLSSSIRRSFKKEVCEYCFNYFHGKTLKYKLMLPSNSTSSSLGLYFCCQSCLDTFQEMDVDNLFLQSLLNIENLFIKGLNRQQSNRDDEEEEEEEEMVRQLKQSRDVELFIDEKWKQMEIELRCRKHEIPSMNENEYLEIKYILGVVFQMYKQETFEVEVFEHLQSNDVAKVFAYPYLLYSYLKIYKILKLSTQKKLQKYINAKTIRSIIGKRLTNVFGIWCEDELGEEKEFFGYALYPSASFFNHSCQPNVIDQRIQSKYIFKLSKNVQKDEELVISYIPSENIPFQLRQQQLKEWFFDCLCQRCLNKS